MIQKWEHAHFVVLFKTNIEDAITDYYLENPSEKELKAVMTSKGNIQIKSAKKLKLKLLKKKYKIL